MRSKEFLKKVIEELIIDYYKNVNSRDEKENTFLIGFIRGIQFSLGMEVRTEFDSLKRKLENYKEESEELK